VYPINAKESVVEGIEAFPSLQFVPARADIVSVYLPPPVLLSLLPGLAAVGIVELWLNPGTDTPEVIAALERLNIPFLQACSLVRLGVNPSDY
jgi:predicted CoA-binding protein